MAIEFIKNNKKKKEKEKKDDLRSPRDHHERFHKTKEFFMQLAWKNRKSNQQYCSHLKRE